MRERRNMDIDPAGIWHNEHGSQLELTVDGCHLRGRFHSGTGLARGADGNDLTGFVSGNLIAFTVDFGELGSLTSWVGHLALENGIPRIHVSWNMCVELPRGHTDDLWRGIWTGADTFERGPVMEDFRGKPARQPSHPVFEWP